MLTPFVLPKTSVIRVRLIQQRLALAPHSNGKETVRIAVTGRTSSGKSTLGNRLIGSDLLQSTGYVDCTDKAIKVCFAAGLEFIDLPGVASKDEFENVNRLALGMPQDLHLAQVDQFTVATYSETLSAPTSTNYALTDIPACELTPDVIIYLLASNQPVGKDEISYLRTLLKSRQSDQIIFAINHIVDPTQPDREMTTPQRLDDICKAVTKAFSSICPDQEGSLEFVHINCLIGSNISTLLEQVAKRLDKSAPMKSALIRNVLKYQVEQTPQEFLSQFTCQTLEFAQTLARQKPLLANGKVELGILKEAVKNTRSTIVESFHLTSQSKSTGHLPASISTVIDTIGAHCKEEIKEPIIEKRETKIYKDVPIYKHRYVTDYDRPIYNEEYESYYDDARGIGEHLGSIFDGFKVKRYRKVSKFSGYGRKREQWIEGYSKEYVRTDYHNEVVGERVVRVISRPFGVHAIGFVAAYIEYILLHNQQLRAVIQKLSESSLPASTGFKLRKIDFSSLFQQKMAVLNQGHITANYKELPSEQLKQIAPLLWSENSKTIIKLLSELHT